MEKKSFDFTFYVMADFSLIAKLRAQTGAGMMDVKNALEAAGGDTHKALEILRKSSALKAAKKTDRATGEGVIGSYVHANGKIAALVEMQCETDFVARNEVFVTLAHDLAMHIAAYNPQYISRDDVPHGIIEKEKEICRGETQGKPAHIGKKMLEGKLENYFAEVCLLDQLFLKDDSQTVAQYIQSKILSLGENIKVAHFCRSAIGSGPRMC